MNHVLDAMARIKTASDTEDITPEQMKQLIAYWNARMKAGIEVLETQFPGKEDKENFIKTISSGTFMLMINDDPKFALLNRMAGDVINKIVLETSIHITKMVLGIVKEEGWFDSTV